MEDFRRLWKVIESYGILWKVIECCGKSYPDTLLWPRLAFPTSFRSQDNGPPMPSRFTYNNNTPCCLQCYCTVQEHQQPFTLESHPHMLPLALCFICPHYTTSYLILSNHLTHDDPFSLFPLAPLWFPCIYSLLHGPYY